MRITLTIVVALICGMARAAVDPATAVATALHQHQSLTQAAPPPAPVESFSEGYEQKRVRAIAENRPLVVWVGGGDALCVACLKTLNEAVHHVAPSFPDTPSQALVVALPVNGELMRVATITKWITGDQTWGHVPSIRRAIHNFRERRATVSEGWSTSSTTTTSYQQQFTQPMMTFQPQFQPQMMARPMMKQLPMRAPVRRGGCAS